MAITLYRAPFSTNVERVTLALEHKGLEYESAWIEYSDRSPVISEVMRSLDRDAIGAHITGDLQPVRLPQTLLA